MLSSRAQSTQQHVRHAHQAAGGAHEQPSAASGPAGDTLDWDGDGGGGGLPLPQDASRAPDQERQEQQQRPGPVRPGVQGRAPAPRWQMPPGVPGEQRQPGGQPGWGLGPPRSLQPRLRPPGAPVIRRGALTLFSVMLLYFTLCPTSDLCPADVHWCPWGR